MDEEGKKLAEKYGVTPQYGKVLGTAYLCGCGEVLDDQASEISWTMHTGISGKESDHERFNGLIERVSMKKEKELGWLGKGRFAWAMDVLDKFENPVPAKGQQGFWKWDGK
jgi:hypothetical protein